MRRVWLAFAALTMVFASMFVAGCTKSADAPAAPASTQEEAPLADDEG
ncbi:MAG: hypothetical protein ACOX5J_14330 [Candidatus Hydrogenedentales bacterium]|jgi:hypothetical protein